ncbi:MAG TPA: hypothetical protein VFP32_01505 [Candidatus Saccharimonadales bacterium]|nr:hypothetical protein [Candidatus Saccharimonadales bacterium]
MEPDGKTRVWFNMQDSEMYGEDRVCETYPVRRESDECVGAEDAQQIRSEADVAFRLDRARRVDMVSYKYWVEMKVLATGDIVTIDIPSGSTAAYLLDKTVVREAERHLGATGLTIINGSGFGFEN